MTNVDPNDLGCRYFKKPLFTAIIITSLLGCGSSSEEPNPVENTPPAESEPITDTSPEPFSFMAVNDVELSAAVISESVTITGINAATDISVTGGQYSINGGLYTAEDSTVSTGDQISLQVTAPDTAQTTTSVEINVGDISATFTVTTAEETAAPTPALTSLIFNLDTIHSINDLNVFDRKKFITIHASHTENDWYNVGTNASSDLITEFAEGYDVYFGRDTGGMRYQLSLLAESATQSGFVDAEMATSNGGNSRWTYKTNTDQRAETQRQHEHRNLNMVVAAQQHPYWPDGKDTGQGWAFSQLDSAAEPFGTATGDYMGQFVAKYFNKNDGVDIYGQPKPKYIEVMNEPLYELIDFAEDPTTIEKVFEFHTNVAAAIKAVNHDSSLANTDVLVGGYTVAFPDFDKQNFDRWEQRDKAFIDIAGENMDFISLHLYDFPAFQNREELRAGSNIEATFDMLEHYMALTLGEVKPFMVSEYGSQVHSLFNQPWLAQRDWYHLRAINSQLMSFLERANNIEMAIPFIPVKAEWGRLSETVPYYARLMRQNKEIEGQTGDEYVYTDMVKFYQLWSNVNGTRVDSYSTDRDFQLDAYVEDNSAYLIINSLEKEVQTIDVSLLGINQDKISDIMLKNLFHDNGTTHLVESDLSSIEELNQLTIAAESTVIIELTFSEDIELPHTQTETKYYADSYKHPITADTSASFNINNVDIAETGEAILRLGLGREHGKSLQPNVTINGNPVEIDPDYRGYDQYQDGQGRQQYFGVIEIPISNDHLQTDNLITIEFADDGGFVTSVAMQYFAHSKVMPRN